MLIIAIFVAAGVSVLARRQRSRCIAVFEVISRILFAIIRMIMWAAPLGAFGGMAYTVAQFGGGALSNLALLMVPSGAPAPCSCSGSSGWSRAGAATTSSSSGC